MRPFILFFCFISILYSCKGGRISEPEVEKNLPDSFVEFYIQFHIDSIYQMDHIVFPLEGIPALTDTIIRPEDFENFKWQKEDWVLHKNISELKNSFQREYQEYEGMIIETISHSSQTFSMTRRFAKLGEEWHLIYYAAMNRN